jgi:hypothetical protein
MNASNTNGPGAKTDYFPGPATAIYDAYSLNCTNGATLGAGATPANQCVLSLDPTPTNGMTLSQGLPVVGPTISLSATGIKLAVGGPVGASIELTPTGITISFGPPGVGSSIALDATGVTIKAGPMNQVQVAQQGLTMQALKVALQSVTQLQVQALQLTETATVVSRTGGTTTMM